MDTEAANSQVVICISSSHKLLHLYYHYYNTQMQKYFQYITGSIKQQMSNKSHLLLINDKLSKLH